MTTFLTYATGERVCWNVAVITNRPNFIDDDDTNMDIIKSPDEFCKPATLSTINFGTSCGKGLIKNS